MSSFYEFEHECEKMPDDIRFCKIYGGSSSQFTVEARTRRGKMTTTFYGFNYCPYCGEKVDDDDR